MQPAHDGTERAAECVRDLAIAELLDVGELDDAALGGIEAA
jgi:hypothetical protein